MRFLVAIAVLELLALVQGDLTLKVICDDISTIFVDGEQKNAAGTGAWNQLATLTLPDNAGAIGIQCRNTGGPYGIMAQVEDAGGEVFEVTDNSWQCSNAPADGWATAEFQGGWAAASYYNHPAYIVDQGAWRGMSPNKRIIWTSTSADTTVYCRKNLPKADSNRLSVICDDIANVFVDGEERQSPGNAAWNLLSTFSVSPGAAVIGVQCRNTGGPYGIMVELQDPHRKVIMVSDDSWKCSNSADDGWTTAEFEEGDNWNPASYYNHGPYSGSGGVWRFMSFNRRIIWTASAADTTVYCRKVLDTPCVASNDPKGVKYRGKLAVTETGHACQRWDAQAPNEHTRTAANYPSFGLEENYCRNPDDAAGLWCYNSEGTTPRWELCDTPKCVTKEAISGAWKVIPGGLNRISKGSAGTWGVNKAQGIYRLRANGINWDRIGGALVQVSSGKSVWGVNRNDMIYTWTGANWVNINGRLTNVDCSESGNVWGVNRNHDIFRYQGDGVWTNIDFDHDALQVSTGGAGVWAVTQDNDIYYRVGTYGDVDSDGTDWTHVPGSLKWIASGENQLVGVDSNDDILYRVGITPDTPTGTSWKHVDGKLINIDVYGDNVVGVNAANNIFRCPMVVPPTPVEYDDCEVGKSCLREAGTGALLKQGAQLVSENGRAKLTMQEDGNLVLSCSIGGQVLWNSGTAGQGGQELKIQADGNMVMYNGDSVLWSSDTDGNADAVELVLQDDHNLVLYKYEDRSVLWASDTAGSDCPDVNYNQNCVADQCVRAPQVASLLPLGKKLSSQNGKGVLTMQADGNLVLTCIVSQEVLWESGTTGVDQGLRIESNGNMLLLDADRNVKWSSDTAGNTDEVRLVLQDDLNIVLYKGDEALWNSETYGSECVPGPSTTGTWARSEGKYLSGYSAGNYVYNTLAESEEHCESRDDCGGITWEKNNNRFTLRRGVELKTSPSGEISYIRLFSDDEGGHIFPATVGIDYNLHKELEVGDVISAWFLFKDHTTSKFNLNIMGPNNMNLLHVDFRPWIDQLVLNSLQPGVGWQTEVRPSFPRSKLEPGKLSKVSVEVLDGEYKVSFNGDEVGRFPQRQDLNLASYIVLRGGSNGFLWTAAQLPPATIEPGLARPKESGEEVHFDGTLDTGDIVTVWGVYADESDAFSVNLRKDASNTMLHIAFRPAERQIVLNSMLNGQWQTEIRTPLPSFEAGRPFKVQIRCMADEFEIYVDGNDIGTTFPYRDGFTLAEVSYEQSGGGSNGLEFTDVAPPVDKNIGQEILTSGLVVEQSSVGWGGNPERAIDSNTNGQWSAGSCTHSAGQANNWWKVTLNQISTIQKVSIFNRLDCCSDRIDGAKVYAGNIYCGSVVYEAGTQRYDIQCNGAVASFIKILQPKNYLTLCEVQVFGVPSDAIPLQNVAKNKPASQSTTGWGGVASRAVDGKISGTWGHGTCSHSQTNTYNEWTVNLLAQYKVDSVVINNRVDCCSSRINGAKVFVDEEECGAIEYQAGVDVYTVSCDGKVGSEVKVTLAGDYLTLCEVQVLGWPSEELGDLINVADNGQASQSTTGWNGVAERAIDGNTNGNYWANSCSHTGDINGGWWKLEFEDPVLVDSVIIMNREDCCADRINGVKVYAGETLCGTISYVEGQVGYAQDCPDYTYANSITIEAAPDQYLTLCEVKVMADPNPEVGDTHLVNLALNKPTSQSSTGWGGVASRGVDGRDSGMWGHGTCTHTAGSGWWKVDLQDKYSVEKVWIKNRLDCCSNRIDGVQVYVGEGADSTFTLCGDITYNVEQFSYEVDCGGLVGNYVKIVNPNTYLTLCEVRVWGPADPVILNLDDEEVVTGNKSAGIDDATSTATCPAGMVVTGCEVIEGGIGQISDGALVEGDKQDQCVAHCSWGSTGVTARAFCSVDSYVDSPCNGPRLRKFTKQYAKGTDPSLSCPAGYVPELCNVHSYWKDRLVNKGIEEQAFISLDKECSISGCTDSNWCDITLVCRLVDLEAYAAAVCPTCDGYVCGDAYECQMIDSDDDDNDEAVPTCVEKQTGCDVDKCGDQGECLPIGAEGYTCNCQDGYEFDEVAGTCLPVHSKYTTVYGDQAVGDDAHSWAACEAGQKVVRCHTYGAPSAADGVTITSSEGITRCEARASHSRIFPVRAVAYCGDDNTFTDPCTQDEIHAIEYRYNSGLSPHVSCPDGYLMESCIFHSPWSQILSAENKAKINSIGSVDVNDDGSCTMTDCLTNPHGHMWCKLTAVCKKLTGSAYLSAACPTCEQVRCAADQECSMVQDLPVCLVRVPGGCEVNKCGDNGDCIEDGPNYECACSQGYKFDGVTCIDVDECDEDPCGNGECVNSAGSYACNCNEGYELVEGTCEDVNECLDSPCSDTERCSNVEGSYICDCLDTFVRDANQDCVCADGYENQDGACADIDECADNPCGENEKCTNTDGNYLCECVDEAEKNEHGECVIFQPLECDVRAKKSKLKAIRGNNVNVKLVGESKKTFKKYAKIQWTKNGENWNPKSDGKAKFNGFTIRKFDAEDAGVYVGSIFIDMNDEQYKCEVEVNIELLEGSVNLSIANAKQLSKKQKSGQPLSIKCDADIQNLKLDDPKSEDNVNWYKVCEDGDVLLDDDDNYEIAREKGSYTLTLKNPSKEDSGTYRCEFDRFDVDASTEVTIEFKK